MTGPAGGRTTVVIATRNRAAELARTPAALCALRPRPPIVLLDNASEDGTAEVAAGFPEVTVIRLGRNPGAAARTVGVALAGAPVCHNAIRWRAGMWAEEKPAGCVGPMTEFVLDGRQIRR